MLVFEIAIPGIWLDYEDQDWCWNIQNQLRSLESQFFEANTALNLFVEAQAVARIFPNSESHERDTRRKLEIQRAIELEREVESSSAEWDAIRFEADIRFKREKWAGGRVPREFEYKRQFIYARAFLYALDAFEKFLGVLAKEPNVPKKVAEFHSEIAEAFPHLRGVRNTRQHIEDRARGLGAGREPKPLDLKPVTNDHIHAPSGGVLFLNNLVGSKYGSTMSDGNYGEVDISPDSMRHLKRILEGVITSFRWHGPQQHAPNV